jgi:hypothetical protein
MPLVNAPNSTVRPTWNGFQTDSMQRVPLWRRSSLFTENYRRLRASTDLGEQLDRRQDGMREGRPIDFESGLHRGPAEGGGRIFDQRDMMT